MRKAPLVVIALAASAVVPVASGYGSNASVGVTLKEFEVIPTVKSVKAGKVTFIVRNTGKVMHEMVVVKTTKAPGSLAGTGKEASEKGAVGEVADLRAGNRPSSLWRSSRASTCSCATCRGTTRPASTSALP